MPARKGAAASTSRSATMPRSATGLLRADHKRVKEIFDKWENGRGRAKSAQLMTMAIQELKVHAQIEEEIFYPAARAAMGEDDDLLNEADAEHHFAKFLIEEIEDGDLADPRIEAKFKVLAENVKHHIREEEGELFPQVADEDFNRAIAQELWERKQQLTQEMQGGGQGGRKSGRGRQQPMRAAAAGRGGRQRSARAARTGSAR